MSFDSHISYGGMTSTVPVSEGFLADDTSEGFLPGVYAEVLLEQHLAGEGLVAVRAHMRLLPRVYPYVHVVRHALVEALATVLAPVLL